MDGLKDRNELANRIWSYASAATMRATKISIEVALGLLGLPRTFAKFRVDGECCEVIS